MLPAADIGGTQHAESLSVGRHDSILDAVVYHLHEMAGAVWTAVQVALNRRPFGLLASRRTRYVALARRERRKNRAEPFEHVLFAADHHAVAAFQPPHAAARADVHVMDLL